MLVNVSKLMNVFIISPIFDRFECSTPSILLEMLE